MNTTENKWFVANDNGDIIGHDMSETAAKNLAEEMKSKKTYHIAYSNGYDDGYVSYDNEPGDSIEHAMTFSSEAEAEAEAACKKLQAEWAARLTVVTDSDESWEALCGDDE